jgi:hypothetical protein
MRSHLGARGDPESMGLFAGDKGGDFKTGDEGLSAIVTGGQH